MAYAHRLEGERRIKLDDFDPAEDAGLKREHAEKKNTKQLCEFNCPSNNAVTQHTH